MTLEGVVANEGDRNIANIQANGVSGGFSELRGLGRHDLRGAMTGAVDSYAGISSQQGENRRLLTENKK